MRVNEIAGSLYEEMESKLTEISMSGNNALQNSRDSSSIILQFISRLKVYVNEYQFKESAEEINFFKSIKPKFLSKLMYYQSVFQIQSRLPVGTSADIKTYYLKELVKINDYLFNNNDFFIYYRSKSTSLDNIYFIRKEPDSWLLLNIEEYETDLSFTTIFDHKLSRIMAYETLSEFLKVLINKMESGLDTTNTAESKYTLNWTGSKASLIELLYALQSAGSCNNGTIDLKNLANHFEHFFNVDLGNYYRVFQEIRIRKISRTTFLDQLKERLVRRMDEADVNPRFK